MRTPSQHRHPSRKPGVNANIRVFDHKTLLGRNPKLYSCLRKYFGVRLRLRDVSAVHHDIECVTQADSLQNGLGVLARRPDGDLDTPFPKFLDEDLMRNLSLEDAEPRSLGSALGPPLGAALSPSLAKGSEKGGDKGGEAAAIMKQLRAASDRPVQIILI